MNNKTITPGPKERRDLFGFLDETGNIYIGDGVFGVGLLTMDHTSELRRLIINYRNSRKYYGEFKFSEITDKNLGLYKEFISLFFDCHNLKFSAVLYDENKLDIKKHFSGDCDRAYNAFCARLISKSLEVSDYIAILSDDRNTKKSDNFEKQIRDRVKVSARRNALFGICKLESHAVSEIQMVDVILGTLAYSYKIKLGIVKPGQKPNAKLRFVKYLQNKINVSELSEEVNLKLRNGIRFYVEEFFKKRDGAMGPTANKD